MASLRYAAALKAGITTVTAGGMVALTSDAPTRRRLVGITLEFPGRADLILRGFPKVRLQVLGEHIHSSKCAQLETSSTFN